MKFKSKSHVAINVTLPSGTNVHVTFMELSGKGSVFYTNSQELAEAIRKHQKFGKLFTEEKQEEEKPAAKKQAAPVNNAEAPVNNEPANTNTASVKEFSSNADAVDYLSERYGISRTKMRTRSAIEEAAKGVGVTIKWK